MHTSILIISNIIWTDLDWRSALLDADEADSLPLSRCGISQTTTEQKPLSWVPNINNRYSRHERINHHRQQLNCDATCWIYQLNLDVRWTTNQLKTELMARLTESIILFRPRDDTSRRTNARWQTKSLNRTNHHDDCWFRIGQWNRTVHHANDLTTAHFESQPLMQLPIQPRRPDSGPPHRPEFFVVSNVLISSLPA